MPRTTLQNMMSVLDPLKTFAWDLVLPRIPGTADTRPITFKCISTSIPGQGLEKVTWEGHGNRLHFTGRRIYDETWEATIIETRDAGTRESVIKWFEVSRSNKNTSGSYKSEYAVTGLLILYDDKNIPVRNIELVGVWVETMPSTQLDNSSGIIQYNVTFSIDMIDES